MQSFYHRIRRITDYYKQHFTRSVSYINNSFSKQIALTFDDGPHPVITRQILNILKKYNVPATFFLSGPAIESAPDLAHCIFTEGHLAGNHGYRHVHPETLSPEVLISGFEKTDILINKFCGEARVLFCRPPYGKTSKPYLSWVKKGGKYNVYWSLDSYDYRNEFSADNIAEMILRDIKGGDILLLHDTRSVTPDVLNIVVPELLRRNYRFLRLDQIFK